MESEGCVLDEAKLDSAIAELLQDENPEEPEPEPEPEVEPEGARPVFPELADQAKIDEVPRSQDTGLAATLRQKWAELRGAA